MICKKMYVLFLAVLFVCSISLSQAQTAASPKVEGAMKALKERTTKLGAPKLGGTTVVEGKNVPSLLFGNIPVNEANAIVDEIKKNHGATATLFVKSGSEYVRVCTNVLDSDGKRGIGTILDPKGNAIKSIDKGEAYYGDAEILGKKYDTGYEPIKDAGGTTIGVWYVGFLK